MKRRPHIHYYRRAQHRDEAKRIERRSLSVHQPFCSSPDDGESWKLLSNVLSPRRARAARIEARMLAEGRWAESAERTSAAVETGAFSRRSSRNWRASSLREADRASSRTFLMGPRAVRCHFC